MPNPQPEKLPGINDRDTGPEIGFQEYPFPDGPLCGTPLDDGTWMLGTPGRRGMAWAQLSLGLVAAAICWRGVAADHTAMFLLGGLASLRLLRAALFDDVWRVGDNFVERHQRLFGRVYRCRRLVGGTLRMFRPPGLFGLWTVEIRTRHRRCTLAEDMRRPTIKALVWWFALQTGWPVEVSEE